MTGTPPSALLTCSASNTSRPVASLASTAIRTLPPSARYAARCSRSFIEIAHAPLVPRPARLYTLPQPRFFLFELLVEPPELQRFRVERLRLLLEVQRIAAGHEVSRPRSSSTIRVASARGMRGRA